MNITYLILFNLGIACWLGLYALIFSRNTFFKMNRFILLGGIFVAAILPFVQTVHWIPQPVVAFSGAPAPVVVSGLPMSRVEAISDLPVFPFRLIFMVVYWSGMAVMSLILTGKLVRLYRTFKKYPHRVYADHTHVITPDGHPVFSFAKYLFAPSGIQEIIYRHELIHIRQKHTLDNLLLEIIKIFCWFNPAVYLYQHALRAVHEYIADDSVTKSIGKSKYANLLLAHLLQVPGSAITHHFFNRSLLQKRLIMLQKKKPPKKAGWKYLLLASLLAVLIFISTSSFALHEKAEEAVAGLGISGMKQPVVLQGIVNDQEGQPMAKVNVMLLGGTRGTITNLKGHFSLKDVPQHGMLQFSMIGYSTITAVVSGNKELHITMYQKPEQINRVVVVGYTKEKIAPATPASLHPVAVNGHAKGEANPPSSHPVVVVGYPKGKTDPAASVRPPKEKIFTFVEQMPQFPGGKTALMKFLHDHIRYPQKARKLHLQGNVLVSFVVGKKGNISEVHTVNDSIGGGLEQEAVRIVNAMPAWRPGRQNGDAAAVLYTLPIRFVLQ